MFESLLLRIIPSERICAFRVLYPLIIARCIFSIFLLDLKLTAYVILVNAPTRVKSSHE